MYFNITEATSLSVFQDKMGRANTSIIGYFTRQKLDKVYYWAQWKTWRDVKVVGGSKRKSCCMVAEHFVFPLATICTLC